MKKHLKGLLSLLTAAACTMAAPALAVPILVDEWAGPSGLGKPITDPDNEDYHVVQAILNYNSANNPDLPLLSEASKIVIQAGNGSYISGDDKILNWTAPLDCDYYYIMTKWGQGGATFDHALHYILAGETVVYNPGGENGPTGLSHVSIWCGDTTTTTDVPDGGATLVLLGIGVSTVGLLRKRILRS